MKWKATRFLINLVLLELCLFIVQQSANSNYLPVWAEVSGMEPTTRRGDLLLLNPFTHATQAGDVVRFSLPGSGRMRIARVVTVHRENRDHLAQILTKGDANPVDDRGLYAGKRWICGTSLRGKVIGYVPFLGYLSIWALEYGWWGHLFSALLAIFGATGHV
ncbi:hypothetical protein BC830DRAFT_1093684 [Chytriomyces sp. MP71]|nr:hypothetical protein BC830DRAFT_1093684 [Chytriomyces sp. MP71]